MLIIISLFKFGATISNAILMVRRKLTNRLISSNVMWLKSLVLVVRQVWSMAGTSGVSCRIARERSCLEVINTQQAANTSRTICFSFPAVEYVWYLSAKRFRYSTCPASRKCIDAEYNSLMKAVLSNSVHSGKAWRRTDTMRSWNKGKRASRLMIVK